MNRFLTTLATLVCVAALWAQPQMGKVYNIVAEDGRILTTVNGSFEHDAYLYMAETISDDEQQAAQWAIVDAKGDGRTITIVNPHSWMSLDQALTTPNKWVLTWDAEQTNTNQQFVITEADDGLFTIGNKAGQYLHELSDGHLQMTTEATHFRFVEVDCAVVFYPGATVRIRSTKYNQVIGTGERTANDTPLVLEDSDDERQGQVWTLRCISADSDAWVLVNALSNSAMDMALTSTPRRPLLWTTNESSNNQRVNIVEAESYEGYFIRNNSSTSYYVATTSADATLTVTSYYWDAPADEAVFTFERATPPVYEVKDWQDETVFDINKLPAHAAMMPYRNTAALMADAARFERAWLDPVGADYLSLNGTWKFRYTADAAQRPRTFYERDYDVSQWDDITVPGCIEMQGYDRPMYVNENYPFNDNPPYTNITVDASQTGPSPVGSYRRTFTLPEGWSERRTILHFDGIYSGAYVWVNGTRVGYTQGGNMDAEFDITPYVSEGDNDIAVEVFRWTDGSYLEGQDMFHMSGIHRDVYLYSVPQTYIRDHVIRADFSTGYDKVPLIIDLAVNGNPTAKQFHVSVLNPDGVTIVDNQAFEVTEIDDDPAQPYEITFRTDIDAPKMYSCEDPQLYTVIISQSDSQGNEEMAFATKYGFCDVQMVGGNSSATTSYITINGVRTYFKGVNTQDTHPVLGRTMDIETMWRDLTMMKQANINMVRTSHYPRSTKMNDMMAYLGLYICNESDVECHKNWSDNRNNNNRIANNPSWLPAMMDRWQRHVIRDRNNPAVVMWSLGNESGNGDNFKAGYALVRSLDPRPIHYEGASRQWLGWGYTDIRSVMYPTRQTIRNEMNNPNQPYFFCEYNHAMGNSCGNLSDLWAEYKTNSFGFYDSPNGIGGCIWDWVDQSIYDPRDILSGDTIAANGYQKYRSGYDFPGPHQGNFVNNGIINADRAWSPELTAVKAAYQYLLFTDYDAQTGRLSMKSRLRHHSTDQLYDLYAIVMRGGVPVEEVKVDMPAIMPDDEGYAYPAISTAMDDEAEYTLLVEARLKASTPWAEAGYPIATADFIIKERAPLPEVTTDPEQPFLTASTTRSSNSNVNIWLENNSVKRLVVGGLTIVDGADDSPVYNDFFWNENDGYNGSSNGNTSSRRTFSINDDKTQSVCTIENTSTKCNTTFTYTTYSHGVIDLNATFEPQTSNLRRIGFSMQLPDNYDVVEYYARGPWENYCDRSQGSHLMRVRTTVDDMYSVYAHPQSGGDHQDLRELRLVDRETLDTLVITTQGQVGFSLSRYDERQYTTYALHPSDLVRQDYILAHFDYMVRGVGNKSCGGEQAFEQYRCPNSGTYEFTLRFEARKHNANEDGINTATQPDVTYADGIVTAIGQQIEVYDLGGTRLAHATDRASLLPYPRGLYLVRINGITYKFLR